MTKKDVLNRALELYPKQIYYKDNEHLFPLDANEDARNAYIKGVTDILNGENVWALLMAAEKVKTDLYGQETNTKYYGHKVIEKVENLLKR